MSSFRWSETSLALRRFAAALGLAVCCVGQGVPAEEPVPERHWSYRPVVRPQLPADGRATTSSAHPIDLLLAAEGDAPGPEASRRDLLRRLKFDLHGLPPTLEEQDAFLPDEAPDAYEQLVDRLLASPHYGERWGRMWLDVVRFADTAGFNADPVRPRAYQYRDYVIRAWNEDRPFDRQILEQLAGDELFPEDEQALHGVGFLRLGPDESNASNVLLARQELLNELTGAVGTVFLGHSLGCAQCHDHKFDAVSQREFYEIQACFAGIVPADTLPLGPAEEQSAYRAALDRWLVETAPLRDELQALEVAARKAVGKERRMKFPALVLDSLDVPAELRTALQIQLAFFAERQIDIPEKELLTALKPEQQARRAELRAALAERAKDRPQAEQALAVFAVTDGRETPPTFLMEGGSYDKPGEPVVPGVLQCCDWRPSAALDVVPPRPGTPGRRAALARWLVDPQHPLTRRVLANRLWQGHFGRGLIDNAHDFGLQTPQPKHAPLLDWLAAELLDHGWRMKPLHRLIVTSAAYRQTSLPGAAGEPGRGTGFPRRRLDAESLRDALLSVSGQLQPELYGPGVRPELPPGYTAREAWPLSPQRTERQRRSVYILAKRNLPYPLLDLFDLPDMHETCARRSVTTTAPQALFLFNGELAYDQARGFAGRLLAADPHIADEPLIRAAWRTAYARDPAPAEVAAAGTFLAAQSARLSAELAAGRTPFLPQGFPKFLAPERAAAVVDLCHVLLNSNEFLYVD